MTEYEHPVPRDGEDYALLKKDGLIPADYPYCDDCGVELGKNYVTTDRDECICFDCADSREAQFLNRVEDY